MTNLDCTVLTCAYNKDHSCSKDNIKVEGTDAKHTRDTFCTSFRERGEGMQNSAAEGTPAKPTEVYCQATTCTFNEQCKCNANHISVAGSTACECQETECASFRCKCD